MFGLPKTFNITVKGMSCPHCEATVSKAAMSVDGVLSAKASHKKNLLTVKAKDESVLAKIKAEIAKTDFVVE